MTTLVVDEEVFTSEAAASLQGFARCGECLARTASKPEGQSPLSEEAAMLQFARCAQCRSASFSRYRG